MLLPSEVRQHLKIDFTSTADWRREQARQWPENAGYLKAAALLDQLAETVDDIDTAYIKAYGALVDRLPDAEQDNEVLRQIGFESWPENAEEFVKAYISDNTRG
jgi:hypothetical protein